MAVLPPNPIDNPINRERGKKCARDLARWLDKVTRENPGIHWGERERWSNILLVYGIIPIFGFYVFDSYERYIFSDDPAKLKLDEELGVAEGGEQIIDVFEFIAPCGDTLKFLMNYLNPHASEEDYLSLAYFDDEEETLLDNLHNHCATEDQKKNFRERLYDLHGENIRIKVVLSFVVHWVKENVPEANSSTVQAAVPADEATVRAPQQASEELDQDHANEIQDDFTFQGEGLAVTSPGSAANQNPEYIEHGPLLDPAKGADRTPESNGQDVGGGETKKRRLTHLHAKQLVKEANQNISEAARMYGCTRQYMSKMYNKKPRK